MRKGNIVAVGALTLALFTACGSQQGEVTPESSETSRVSETSAGRIWFYRLIHDGDYTLQEALADNPIRASDFDGEVVFDELLTGDFTSTFDAPVPAGGSVRLSIMCDSTVPWSSTLDPIHSDGFSGGGQCTGFTRFTSKPTEEDLDSWTVSIEPEKPEMSYRLILETLEG